CNCNNHQYPNTTCDALTGKCVCTHHTTGDHCELCSPGYYGDATLGQPDSCKPCMCPGNVNDMNASALVHSSLRTCNTTSATTYVCNCDPSYIGDKCDKCADGYYGTPDNPNVRLRKCQWCDCSNYNDGSCDSVTGNCTKCDKFTTGVKCQQCMPLYYSPNITLSKQCYRSFAVVFCCCCCLAVCCCCLLLVVCCWRLFS
ncbi:hypothetical protein HELRODRAFT_76869, partial [Helobdella robusta]|uniref:Laminin EGF-like domain-containing protein n=1 Tax=Helobdella robusta TaxID=6412 RepID=T1G2Q3_HELRO